MAVICSECQHTHTEPVKQCKRCKFPFTGEWPSLVARTINNYQLVRRVGGGGFGAVYEARHVALGNSFAVKILHPKLAQDQSFTDRFQAEARVLAELQHENVLQVIDFGFSEDVGFYLITEWLEGNSLYRVLRSHPKPQRGWIWELFAQLLDALSYAHARGIIHRDLKPENLVLVAGSRGRMVVKIVDFGIAQIVGGQGTEEQERSKYAVGTPYYMAPEQVRGEVARIGAHTDLYACGVILAEVLTGQRPFDGGGQRETMRLQLEAFLPRLAELDPDDSFSETLEQLVQTAAHKEIEHRFPSAQAFSAALDTAMKEIGVQPITEDIYQNVKDVAVPIKRQPRRAIVYRKKSSTGAGLWVWMFVGLAALSIGFVGWIWYSLNSPATVKKKPPKRRKLILLKGWDTPSEPRKIPGLGTSLPDPETGAAPDAGTQAVSDQDPTDDESKKDTNLVAPGKDRIPGGIKKQPSIPTGRRKQPQPRRKTSPPPRVARTSPPSPLISLRLLSKPSGAEVWVDEQNRGKTPVSLRVERGRVVNIVLKKKGYVSKTLTVTPTRSTQQSVTLIEDLF